MFRILKMYIISGNTIQSVLLWLYGILPVPEMNPLSYIIQNVSWCTTSLKTSLNFCEFSRQNTELKQRTKN